MGDELSIASNARKRGIDCVSNATQQGPAASKRQASNTLEPQNLASQPSVAAADTLHQSIEQRDPYQTDTIVLNKPRVADINQFVEVHVTSPIPNTKSLTLYFYPSASTRKLRGAWAKEQLKHGVSAKVAACAFVVRGNKRKRCYNDLHSCRDLASPRLQCDIPPGEFGKPLAKLQAEVVTEEHWEEEPFEVDREMSLFPEFPDRPVSMDREASPGEIPPGTQPIRGKPAVKIMIHSKIPGCTPCTLFFDQRAELSKLRNTYLAIQESWLPRGAPPLPPTDEVFFFLVDAIYRFHCITLKEVVLHCKNTKNRKEFKLARNGEPAKLWLEACTEEVWHQHYSGGKNGVVPFVYKGSGDTFEVKRLQVEKEVVDLTAEGDQHGGKGPETNDGRQQSFHGLLQGNGIVPSGSLPITKPSEPIPPRNDAARDNVVPQSVISLDITPRLPVTVQDCTAPSLSTAKERTSRSRTGPNILTVMISSKLIRQSTWSFTIDRGTKLNAVRDIWLQQVAHCAVLDGKRLLNMREQIFFCFPKSKFRLDKVNEDIGEVMIWSRIVTDVDGFTDGNGMMPARLCLEAVTEKIWREFFLDQGVYEAWEHRQSQNGGEASGPSQVGRVGVSNRIDVLGHNTNTLRLGLSIERAPSSNDDNHRNNYLKPKVSGLLYSGQETEERANNVRRSDSVETPNGSLQQAARRDATDEGKEKILVTSLLPGTNPLITMVRRDQQYKDVRSAWLKVNGLARNLVSPTLLISDGQRVLDHDTIGLSLESTRVLRSRILQENVGAELGWAIHVEVVTEKMWNEHYKQTPEGNVVENIDEMVKNCDYEMTQSYVNPPPDVTTSTCECEDNCSSGDCPCWQWGAGCLPSCTCHQDTDSRASLEPENSPRHHHYQAYVTEPSESFSKPMCKNIYTTWLPQLFGKDYMNEHRRLYTANPCFASFLKSCEDETRIPDRKVIEARILQERSEISKLKDKGHPTRLPHFHLPRKNSREYAGTMDIFLRHALGADEDESEPPDTDGTGCGASMFYSFCDRKWVRKNRAWHCWECGRCRSRASWWHCGECGKCVRGIEARCGGCGGVSEREREEMVKRRDEREGLGGAGDM